MTEAKALAISGSNPTGEAPFSCCLRIGGTLRTACSPAGERGDVARLATQLLVEAGTTAADLDELRIDLGPGSYTGLRVAITFVRFVQHFGDVNVVACDTLALLASDADSNGRLRPLLDARRDRFHCGTLTERDGVLHHQQEPRAMPLPEVLASIADGDTFVVPPNLGAEPLEALRDVARIHTATGITAERLFSPRIALARCTTAELEPRYLMGSYAE